jgi:proteasome accessory factor A
VIFTGSGGWNNLAPGLEFTLSPRVPHLKRIVSTESTHSRGLIHDASSRGRQVDRETDHRIHLTIGESLSSEVALVLKAGTTALVVALIEASVNPGEGVELAKPLVAIQAFSRDASCRQSAEIKGRRRLRAIDIQRHYLRLAEQQVGALPVWAGAVLQLWAQVLDGLEDGSEQQRMRLEWVIRRKVFERYLTSRGFDWSNLPAGHEKADLFELDNKLGRVGRAGMFPLLDQLGALNHRIDVTGFPKEPVPTRATVRGKAIGACFASGLTDSCRGDWNYILDRKNRMVLDLGDPFETCLNWRPKAETLGFDFHAWGLR